ncbi:MAG: hypothetical protein AMXMBFR64_20220 [Myxococcales bacterium]
MTRAPLIALVALLSACAGSGEPSSPGAGSDAAGTGSDAASAGPTAVKAPDGTVAVAVVVPAGAGPALTLAAEDLAGALAQMVGAPAKGPVADAEGPAIRVRTDGEPSLGAEGYRFETSEGITVVASTEQGAAYGLWHVARALGVRWLRPDDTFIPLAPEATLPALPAEPQVPHFALRGFHEHTQHPIPMSDYLLRPGNADFRARLGSYARWMARNRQNVLFFHMLKTVDLDAWVPYMADFTAEARGLGVTVGAILSFADQQQNNFKLVREDAVDTTGAPVPADIQIQQGLDRVLEAGLGRVGFQYGTSEFTKPTDATALGWLDVAVKHLQAKHPDVVASAWIHITCSLEAEAGGKYFHLPLKSDGALGAFVHTTMFYDADHPAPVYDCEDFHHQKEFMDASGTTRELTWFPESAWWLGFDDNVPLALPITGWSREHDVRKVLAGRPVTGHVTFTTGREWMYWQYDHYLTELTWDGDLSWADYLESLTPLYGEQGHAVVLALAGLTELQRQALYEDNPLLIFYLAGELPQDEIGAQAGILARRPKLPYRTVVGYTDAELAAWKASDLDRLHALRDAVAPLIAPLPEVLAEGTEQQQRLYREARRTLWTFGQRLDHVIALYEAVVAVRAGDRAAAEAGLATAKGITAAVTTVLQAAEADYQDPVAILARDKPETLTSYPYGYLAETSAGFFWSRRDDQLAGLIAEVFDAAEQAWSAPVAPVWPTVPAQTTLQEPQNPLAGAVLTGFVPRLLLGVSARDGASLTVALAQDHDANDLPDGGTEAQVAGTLGAQGWEGTAPTYDVSVRDQAGQSIGTLTIHDVVLRSDLAETGGALSATTAELGGFIAASNLVALVMSVGGIDEEGARNLIAGVYGVETLPDDLPMRFGFVLGGPLP